MSFVQDALYPASRFSDRADNYLLYRPAYPGEIVRFLQQELGIVPPHRVADIGSGTGLFSELLLRNGYAVTGVEPNAAMRAAAEKRLQGYSDFTSMAACSEATGLDSESTDLITVAQAFHWMDPVLTREEFSRILKPDGQVVILSTVRKKHSAFLAGYDELKQAYLLEPLPAIPDAERVSSFFGTGKVACAVFPHQHWLDFDGLKGLLLSSSAIPLPGHPAYDTMISTLVQLFVVYNRNGFVEMEYETRLYGLKPGTRV